VTVKQILGNVFLVVLSASLAEGALQVASRISPTLDGLITNGRTTVLLQDERLGQRGNPAYREHDEWGYRNASRPAHADIVAMGDSQTWGTSVAAADTWPTRLAEQVGQPVYNMGLGSFGPGQYLLEIDRALSLEPHVVVVAVYFGNDFYDAFKLSRSNPEIGALVPPAEVGAVDELERREPLERQANVLFFRDESRGRDQSSVRGWTQQSKLWVLLGTLRRQLMARVQPMLSGNFDTARKGLSPAERQYCSIFDDGEWRTILTPRYRALVVNDRDVRIRAGVDVSREALERIAERAKRAGSRLVVVFLPTKENVFAGRITDRAAHPGLSELVENEERLKAELVADLEQHGIAHVDVLDALRRVDRQPYFEDADGHLNPLGHETVATEVAKVIGGPPAITEATRR
jgi:lysophospholipase L1-like esterase